MGRHHNSSCATVIIPKSIIYGWEDICATLPQIPVLFTHYLMFLQFVEELHSMDFALTILSILSL